DPHPADHEDEVVRAERCAAEREEDEVGIAEIGCSRMGLMPERPAEADEECAEQQQLDRAEQAAVPGRPAGEVREAAHTVTLSTADPRISPRRMRSRASFAPSSGNSSTSAR